MAEPTVRLRTAAAAGRVLFGFTTNPYMLTGDIILGLEAQPDQARLIARELLSCADDAEAIAKMVPARRSTDDIDLTEVKDAPTR